MGRWHAGAGRGVGPAELAVAPHRRPAAARPGRPQGGRGQSAPPEPQGAAGRRGSPVPGGVPIDGLLRGHGLHDPVHPGVHQTRPHTVGGGVLALAMARELTPVVTAIIVAGRVGSAFAAELGTMQVSEQIDSLRMLRTDPVDYLVTPRVLASCIALPVLSTLSFTLAMGASTFIADAYYDVAANVILESASRALASWDIVTMGMKSVAFGGVIAVISCTYGLTTSGGAKGVGETTTNAVVVSLVSIFIIDFVLSWIFFHNYGGDALRAAMG